MVCVYFWGLTYSLFFVINDINDRISRIAEVWLFKDVIASLKLQWQTCGSGNPPWRVAVHPRIACGHLASLLPWLNDGWMMVEWWLNDGWMMVEWWLNDILYLLSPKIQWKNLCFTCTYLHEMIIMIHPIGCAFDTTIRATVWKTHNTPILPLGSLGCLFHWIHFKIETYRN